MIVSFWHLTLSLQKDSGIVLPVLFLSCNSPLHMAQYAFLYVISVRVEETIQLPRLRSESIIIL